MRKIAPETDNPQTSKALVTVALAGALKPKADENHCKPRTAEDVRLAPEKCKRNQPVENKAGPLERALTESRFACTYVLEQLSGLEEKTCRRFSGSSLKNHLQAETWNRWISRTLRFAR
jgi:hypothetical protein